jgi:hypothetical protein
MTTERLLPGPNVAQGGQEDIETMKSITLGKEIAASARVTRGFSSLVACALKISLSPI